MGNNTVYRQVYQLLNQVTPLKKDCGILCNKACCKGIDSEAGMYLFPGEEKLSLFKNWLTIRPVRGVNYPIFLAICNGECDRNLRPLACRIFPLTPYINSKDALTIKMDPRGYYLCPLVRTLKYSELNPEFVKKVRLVGKLLITDPTIKEFIVNLSRLIDETAKFQLR